MNQKGFNFIALIVPIIVIAVAVFFYIRSPESLPPDRLYFIKKAREGIFLATNSLNYESLINANVELANERVEEVRKLMEIQAKEELIRDTLIRLEDNQKRAVDYSLRIKKRGSYIADYLNKIEEALRNHREILSNLYYFAPKSLYEDLDKAVEISNELIDLTKESRYN